VEDTESSVKQFLGGFQVTFPTGMDKRLKIAKAFGFKAMPLTVFVTRDGRIAERVTGPISEEELVEVIERLLSGRPPPHQPRRSLDRMSRNDKGGNR